MPGHRLLKSAIPHRQTVLLSAPNVQVRSYDYGAERSDRLKKAVGDRGRLGCVDTGGLQLSSLFEAVEPTPLLAAALQRWFQGVGDAATLRLLQGDG